MSKVKMVKFHTNVQIDGKYESYATAEQFMSAKGLGANATITETDFGVTLETPHSLIKVGWSNIVFLSLDKTAEIPKVSKAK